MAFIRTRCHHSQYNAMWSDARNKNAKKEEKNEEQKLWYEQRPNHFLAYTQIVIIILFSFLIRFFLEMDVDFGIHSCSKHVITSHTRCGVQLIWFVRAQGVCCLSSEPNERESVLQSMYCGCQRRRPRVGIKWHTTITKTTTTTTTSTKTTTRNHLHNFVPTPKRAFNLSFRHECQHEWRQRL